MEKKEKDFLVVRKSLLKNIQTNGYMYICTGGLFKLIGQRLRAGENDLATMHKVGG